MKAKMILIFVLVLAAIILIPLGVTRYFLQQESISEPDDTKPVPLILEEFPSTAFSLNEGYLVNIVDGWELTSQTPERNVDRYRFDRTGANSGTFTISFYSDHASFAEVIEARYGGGYVSDEEDLSVNGREAKRVTSAFLDQGDSADIIVKVGENSFISLYGIHLPEGEGSSRVTEEIFAMQMSFESQE